MNYKKQIEYTNLSNLFDGYYQRFIDEYEGFVEPVVIHDGVEFRPRDYRIEWRSDILIGDDNSLLVPATYRVTNYKSETYHDINGRPIQEADYDVDPEYEKKEDYIISYYTILNWIADVMEEDEHIMAESFRKALNELLDYSNNK